MVLVIELRLSLDMRVTVSVGAGEAVRGETEN